MALAVTIQIDMKDAKNKSSFSRVRVPTGFSIAQYAEFAADFGQLVSNATTCAITGISINFALDLSSATLVNTVTVAADVAHKAFIQMRSAVAGFVSKFKIPTFDEDGLTLAGTEEIDTSDVFVAALLAGLENGYDLPTGGVMAPVDKYGNDLTTPSITRTIFQSHA